MGTGRCRRRAEALLGYASRLSGDRIRHSARDSRPNTQVSTNASTHHVPMKYLYRGIDVIALGADNVYDHVVGDVLFDLLRPPAHLFETLFIDDAVDE